MNPVPHSRPTLGAEEAKAVAAVVRSGHIAKGEKVRNFEKAFCRKMGLSNGVALSSGTAALHLVLLALGVGSGDEVILPGFVCTALLNAVRYVGADPVIAEVLPETGNIDPADAVDRITRKTRALIVPHMFGLPADIGPLLETGIPVIEDCAQTFCTEWKGRPLGTLGRASVFSFYATKLITTGEGGMAASKDAELLSVIRDLSRYDQPADGKTRYNYKMTDMAAVMGGVQLERLDGFIQRRKEIALLYDEAFACLDLRLPRSDPAHIYYRYVLTGCRDVERAIQRLRREGIDGARPVHRPLHVYLGLNGYAKTEAIWNTALSVPIYPSLSDPVASQVAEQVSKIVEAL